MGGNAVTGVGTIHIDEINATLAAIGKVLDIPDIASRTLGSVGKQDYSGDIDLAIKDFSADELAEVVAKLKAHYDEVNVVGKNVFFKAPIVGYNPDNDARQPRTGFVQVDLIPGDVEWNKFYYHSPGKSSKFKGNHRNVGIAAIARELDVRSSDELDQFDRPIEQIRWKFGPNGLIRVKRTSVWNDRKQEYNKGQVDTELDGRVMNDAEIAKILFNGKAGKEALNSVESLVDAVKLSWDAAAQERIFRAMAKTFSTDAKRYGITVDGYEFPQEISQYIVKEGIVQETLDAFVARLFALYEKNQLPNIEKIKTVLESLTTNKERTAYVANLLGQTMANPFVRQERLVEQKVRIQKYKTALAEDQAKLTKFMEMGIYHSPMVFKELKKVYDFLESIENDSRNIRQFKRLLENRSRLVNNGYSLALTRLNQVFPLEEGWFSSKNGK